MEHSAIIWKQIQTAKRQKTNLHVVWLNLVNAYGSVPHLLISFALDFFHVPSCIQKLIDSFFSSFFISYASQESSTEWHRLEKGIAMGCSISPILFTAAFEIHLIGGRQMARGVRCPTGQRVPAIQSYMDDVTNSMYYQAAEKAWGTVNLGSEEAQTLDGLAYQSDEVSRMTISPNQSPTRRYHS